MKNLLLIICISNLFIANAYSFGHADFVELDANSPVEDMSTDHLVSYPSKTGELNSNIHMRNFTSRDQQKVNLANQILLEIINSEEFKDRVLNFTFKGEKQFNDNQGKTNQQIYDHLMTGSEVLMPGSAGTMNFDLTLYKSKNPWSKVKGYTKPDTMRIWINKKFFRKSSWKPRDVAANMMHEWIHKMGYTHDYKYNQDRQYTVPYAIGYILNDIAQELGYE